MKIPFLVKVKVILDVKIFALFKSIIKNKVHYLKNQKTLQVMVNAVVNVVTIG